jgi:hypothetical protein
MIDPSQLLLNQIVRIHLITADLSASSAGSVNESIVFNIRDLKVGTERLHLSPVENLETRKRKGDPKFRDFLRVFHLGCSSLSSWNCTRF